MRSNVYSVSQVNKYIKNMFLTDYMLQNLEVKGEVSNLKYHSSGHIYFTLKDEKGAIRCVMFSSSRTAGLKFLMKDGMQVIVRGSCDVYERDGSYQLYAREIKQDGVGNLYEEFEKLKARLEEQGMFDSSFKRPIPKFIKTLGVVTAPTGAAVRDIIDVSKRRNPGIQIVLFPAIVQGDEAPASIVKGIKTLEAYGVDVMIVGRGGGSIEDLWGFNDEKVAQAIFDCSVPVISAVGHETDFTIADFVSDLRAPTPSAAAELAVSDVSALIKSVRDENLRLGRAMRQKISDARKADAFYAEKLERLSPVSRLNENKQKLKNMRMLLTKDMQGKITESRHRLELTEPVFTRNMKERLLKDKNRLSTDAAKLHGLSPLIRLSGGYAYVSGGKAQAVKSIKDVSEGEILKVHVTDGVITSTVIQKEENEWQSQKTKKA